MHHNICFNLFLLDNNSFDNQGSKIKKPLCLTNAILLTLNHVCE